MTQSYSSTTVSGKTEVGGLVGHNDGLLTRCYSTGVVSGTGVDQGVNLGGLVGSNTGTVTQSRSTGAVSGGMGVGGLVAHNDGHVSQCYSTGTVTGSSDVGGLVGINSNTVTECYSTGAVSGTGEYVGGLVGATWGRGYVTASFWGTQTSCQAKSAGGTGKTTAEMQDIRTYQDAGWDFWGESEDGLHEIWQKSGVGVCPALAVFGGYTPPRLQGSGTPEDPYLISNAVELGAIVRYSPSAYYRLAASIDLSGIRWGTAVIPSFAGTLDGNGLTISHLTVTGGGDVGLCQYLTSGAEVKDLGLVDVNIVCSGIGASAGGLAGYNNGTVTRCYSVGVVDGVGSWPIGEGDPGPSGVGGLVGVNNGTLAHCYSNGIVTGSSRMVGGLVGLNWGDVADCNSASAVSAYDGLGGLVGRNEGTVIRCYSTGTVTGPGQWSGSVGGLVGINSNTVTQCYSTGAVSGTNYVGGLVGQNWAGSVTQCYSTGAVSGKSTIGGLVGENSSTGSVTQCYSTGAVSGSSRVGGLVGSGAGSVVTACFWDTQTSGQATSAGGTGKTTAEMQTAKTFLDAGWDFVGEIENGTSEVWQMPPGGGYPVFAIFNGYTPPQLQGSGTPQDPYLASNALELGAIVHHNSRACYRLSASVDLSGIRWGTALVPWSSGVFDGNGHTLSHLTIQGGGHLGLFGQLASAAEVKNLGVVDVNITGSGDYVGGLVRINSGTVTQCYSTGAVSGRDHVGGLVGQNRAGSVTQCYSTAAVNGGSDVGGLVGQNWAGSVAQCYSTGAVSGKDHVGGLVGYNRGGTVTDCYSAGPVSGSGSPQYADAGTGGLVGYNGWGDVTRCYSTSAVSGTGDHVGGLVGSGAGSVVTACFWDIQTSRQTKSAGGTGKTTAEMQTAKTFLDAGWDFIGETANGTEDLWWILEGKDYPRLWWEARN